VNIRHQRGYLYRNSGFWYLRYSDREISRDGFLVRKQKAHRLIEASATKTAARVLADEFLAPLNDGQGNSQSAGTLAQFVERRYLPFVKAQKRPSTYCSYSSIWRQYLQPLAAIRFRDFHTADAERMLAGVAANHQLTGTTLRHVKAFLSGAFRYAKRLGVINRENPIRDVVVPRGGASRETHAYPLDEILRMIDLLPEPAATIVAAAAFTGARRGELRGFSWEGYDGHEIRIERSYWRNRPQEPKTAKSKAPVPVIAQLAERLNRHRETQAVDHEGLMFHAITGSYDRKRPIDLDALARDVIKPILERNRLKWHGWHAFRRGLATNLHQLGVQDKVIQRILRHSNVSVTQACYIKTADADVVAAMHALETAPNMHPPHL
jgi:integrase